MNTVCTIAGIAASFALFAPLAQAGMQTQTIDFFNDDEAPVGSMLRLFLPELDGRRIVETRLTLEFTPAPGFDVGSFYVLIAPPVEPDEGEDGFIVLDAFKDLGWSGSETRRVELTFSALNGVLSPGLWGVDLFPTLDPPLLIGRFSADSRWEIDTIEVPAPAATSAACFGGVLMLRRRRQVS